jgi:hypothetical protein
VPVDILGFNDKAENSLFSCRDQMEQFTVIIQSPTCCVVMPDGEDQPNREVRISLQRLALELREDPAPALKGCDAGDDSFDSGT